VQYPHRAQINQLRAYAKLHGSFTYADERRRLPVQWPVTACMMNVPKHQTVAPYSTLLAACNIVTATVSTRTDWLTVESSMMIVDLL
jgi:hypothetical protein